MNTKPSHWFKTVDELTELHTEPEIIEYLKISTGETYIHTYGTVFWDSITKTFDIQSLKDNGISHWRIPTHHTEYKKFHGSKKIVPDTTFTPLPHIHDEHYNLNPEFVNI